MLFLHVTHLAVQESRHAQREAESAAAHRLLKGLAAELGLPEARIAKTEKGRPFFEGLPTVDFSLSHTAGLAVCALSYSTGASIPRVGVDAESKAPYSDAKITALAARFFGEHEQAHVAAATDKQTAFTEVFVRKEAFAKYTGEGLARHWGGTDTLHPDFEHTQGVRFFAYQENNIHICLCAPEGAEPPPCTIKK